MRSWWQGSVTRQMALSAAEASRRVLRAWGHGSLAVRFVRRLVADASQSPWQSLGVVLAAAAGMRLVIAGVLGQAISLSAGLWWIGVLLAGWLVGTDVLPRAARHSLVVQGLRHLLTRLRES